MLLECRGAESVCLIDTSYGVIRTRPIHLTIYRVNIWCYFDLTSKQCKETYFPFQGFYMFDVFVIKFLKFCLQLTIYYFENWILQIKDFTLGLKYLFIAYRDFIILHCNKLLCCLQAHCLILMDIARKKPGDKLNYQIKGLF